MLSLWRVVREKDDLVDDGRELLNDEALGRHVFFARQVVQNACATQAIVSVLLNRPEVRLGAGLEAFKDFTMDLPPDMRGEAIGNSDFIRKAHNAFARPEPFVFEEKKDDGGEAEDAFHFIGYVPVRGELYELDGLKSAPITLGKVEGGGEGVAWLQRAKECIERRVQRYAEREIRFNLLALVRTPRDALNERLEDIRKQRAELQQQQPPAAADSKMVDADAASPDAAALRRLDEEERDVQQRLADEELKHSKWRVENARRQHNYVPFIFNVLKLLAEKGQLHDLVESAAKVTAEKNAKLIAQRQKKRDDDRKAKNGKTATHSTANPAPTQTDTKPQ